MISIVENKDGTSLPNNLITEFLTPDMIKTLYYHCLRVDIPDNNTKAEMIKAYLPSAEFDELGTGTNRIAFLHNGLVVKIALDRRGLVDTYTEFKRSMELPNFLARTYESNMLIAIQQYVNVIDEAQFMANREIILSMLSQMSDSYLFEDIGFDLKNSYNWGWIEAEGGDELRILDYGYLYPLALQDKEKLFRCPRCNGKLEWDKNFTKFKCNNSQCGYTTSPFKLRNRMSTDFDDLENATISELNNIKMPNFKDIEKLIRNIK